MSARPRRSPLARRLTTGLALAGALVALAALALTTAAARAAGGGPWQNPSYTPRPGDWRPYVLAPSYTHDACLCHLLVSSCAFVL